MLTVESPVSQRMVNAGFHTVLAARGLALTDTERALAARLRPLLALPADALLQRLLDDGPWWWDSHPSLARYLR